MGAKKDFILQVRISDYELELLDRYAGAMRMNRSDYVRYCMLKQRLTEGMKGNEWFTKNYINLLNQCMIIYEKLKKLII